MQLPTPRDDDQPAHTDYRCLTLSTGETVIYDPANPDAWIQSAIAYDL